MLLENNYYPLLVSEDGTAQTETPFLVYREKIRRLDSLKQAILLSQELAEQIFSFGQKFSVPIECIGQVSAVIREILFGDIDWNQCEASIRQIFMMLGHNPSLTSEAILFIKTNIMTIVPKVENEGDGSDTAEPNLIRIPLLEALAKYPQLGQQTVTTTRVKLQVSTEPMRGSLLNWLRFYREELGVGYHDAMSRGQFLFHSQNGSKLTNEERERLSLILRSIEDHEPVEIDTQHQVIVFPLYSSESRQNMSTVSSAPAPFSSRGVATAPTTAFLGSEVATQSRQIAAEPSRMHSVGAPSTLPVADGAPVSVGTSSIPTIDEAPVSSREREVSSAPAFTSGTLHVADTPILAQSTPSAPRSLGTLQFSSKHVLPAEKEFLAHEASTESGKGTAAPSLPPRPVPSEKAPSSPVHPPQAPKRTPGRVSGPFRIDPIGLNDWKDQ